VHTAVGLVTECGYIHSPIELYMVPTPPGKFLKVLEFRPPPLSKACKVLEISVGSGKFWKFDVIVLEKFLKLLFEFDIFALRFVWVHLKNYGYYLCAYSG